MSFNNFLNKFILKVIITNSVLSLIIIFELIKFKNKISQINFKQIQTLLNIYKDYMFSKKITILEFDDCFFNASCNNELYLLVFRYKRDYNVFVSNEKMSRELEFNYISLFYQHTFKADIRNAIKRIF